MDPWSVVWLIAGAILIVAERVVPGRSARALGLGAVVTGLGRWGGLWSGALPTLTAWFVASLIVLLARRAPGGVRS
jgi:membrane protein implicated in regulation of membrane protease activity